MTTSLADKYHDEQGRPITPAAPPRSPRIVPPRTLEPWQIALRDRATARAEARGLGPLANTPQARAAFHRDEQTKTKGRHALAAAALASQKPEPQPAVEPAAPKSIELTETTDAAILDTIDEAFSYPAPVVPPPAIVPAADSLTHDQITELIGMVEAAGLCAIYHDTPTPAPAAAPAAELGQPPAAGKPDWAAISARHHERLAELHAENTQAERQDLDSKGPIVIPEEIREAHATAKTPNQRTAASENPTPALDPGTAPADLGGADDRAARRRAGALKAAATVRTRRAAAEHKAGVTALMEKSLDRIGERIIAANRRADHEAAEAIANPGIPTAAALVDLARAQNAEADLFRVAHANRAPHHAAQWSPAQRETIANQFNALLSKRQTRTTKGTAK